MFARQREFGGVVIELRSQPLRGGVATLAVLGESRGLVHGVLGSLPVFQVA